MATAHECAAFILRRNESGEPQGMALARLHRLLYLAQGWNMAWEHEPLFDNEIQAWAHGPILPGMWDGDLAFDKERVAERWSGISEAGLTGQQRLNIDAVLASYSPLETWAISAICKGHLCFRKARKGLGEFDRGSNKIRKRWMMRDFSVMLKACQIQGYGKDGEDEE